MKNISYLEENTDDGLVTVKLRNILDEPNMNGITITKESFLKTINSKLERDENIYITKTMQGTERFTPKDRMYDVDVEDILGIIHAIDLEHKSAYVEPLEMNKDILEILTSSTFGFRAIGHTHQDENGNMIADITEIISYDMVK